MTRPANPKATWCDRSLVRSPLYYGLCTSEKAFHYELRRFNVARDLWPVFVSPSADATVHYFDRLEGQANTSGPAAIVCIPLDPQRSGVSIAALLVHESMHIWRRIRELIGENDPSSECEAYAVQNIAQNLMEAYAAALKAAI